MPGCFIPVVLENCYLAKYVLAVAGEQCIQSTTKLSTAGQSRVVKTLTGNTGASHSLLVFSSKEGLNI